MANDVVIYTDVFEVSDGLEIVHYKSTKEISLLNTDDGEEFLIADYGELEKVINIFKQILNENGGR